MACGKLLGLIRCVFFVVSLLFVEDSITNNSESQSQIIRKVENSEIGHRSESIENYCYYYYYYGKLIRLVNSLQIEPVASQTEARTMTICLAPYDS